ncbi:MAG: serpin family protein [Rufibacter sp.]
MKKKILHTLCFGLAIILSCPFSSCQQDEPTPDNNLPNVRPLTEQENNIVTGANSFAFKSFAQISQLENDKNVFISPLSLSMALTMAYNGAASTTKEGIKETLGFGNATDEDINQSFKSLTELLVGIDKKVTFTAANSLWLNNHYQLKAPFVNTNQTYFNATLKSLDFSSPNAKTEINNWVKDNTQGKIPSIVESVTQDHLLFLVNAIYFKGTWTYQFKKELTQSRPFQLQDGSSISHPSMTLTKGKYLLYQDNTKILVDLPYGNKQYSMTLLMPQEPQTVASLATELTPANMAAWLEQADSTSLELHLPKFKLALSYDNVLIQTLKNLGMGEAFTGNANFSGMVQGGQVAISQVNHKTFLDVNEEGTEAAAATSVGVVVTSLPAAISFNRPFIFMIREKSSNAILFIGKLMKPEYQ